MKYGRWNFFGSNWQSERQGRKEISLWFPQLLHVYLSVILTAIFLPSRYSDTPAQQQHRYIYSSLYLRECSLLSTPYSTRVWSSEQWHSHWLRGPLIWSTAAVGQPADTHTDDRSLCRELFTPLLLRRSPIFHSALRGQLMDFESHTEKRLSVSPCVVWYSFFSDILNCLQSTVLYILLTHDSIL